MKYIRSITLIVNLAIISSAANAQWGSIQSAPSGYIKDIAITNGILYLGMFNDGVYTSTDSATTWVQINNGLNSQQAKSVYQLLIYNGDIYAATVDGIYKSTDGGQNWSKKSHGITIGPGALYEFAESIFEYNGVLFTGAWNGIYSSADNGENWEITNVSGQGVGPGFFVNHYGTLFAARENINTPYGYVSTDDGETWDPLTTILGPTITFLSEPNQLWSGTIFGVWLSENNGASWLPKSNGLPPDPYNSSIIRVDEKLVTSVKFGGSGIFYSEDEGANWIDFGEGLPFLSSIEEVIVFGDQILSATSSGLWQRDISDLMPEFTCELTYISGSPVPPAGGNVYYSIYIENVGSSAASFDGWLDVSYEGGPPTVVTQRTFTDFQPGWTINRPDMSFPVPSTYAAGDYSFGAHVGNYPSTVLAEDFFPFSKSGESDGEFALFVPDGLPDPFDLSDTGEKLTTLPDEYELLGAYPNPFNPTTTISYTLPKAAKVNLSIYNTNGSKAADLVNGWLGAGYHEVTYNAANRASGVYIYRLEADNYQAFGKMVLLK